MSLNTCMMRVPRELKVWVNKQKEKFPASDPIILRMAYKNFLEGVEIDKVHVTNIRNHRTKEVRLEFKFRPFKLLK